MPLGRQWLGIGWASWRGQGGGVLPPPFPMHPCPPPSREVLEWPYTAGGGGNPPPHPPAIKLRTSRPLSLTQVREGQEKHNAPLDVQWPVEHAMN